MCYTKNKKGGTKNAKLHRIIGNDRGQETEQ